MIRCIDRQFEVSVPLADAWNFLARVEKWPAWAAHIARIDVSPPGPVGPRSSGRIYLKNGIRSTFRVREFNEGTNWMWVGAFLWLTIYYDHRFEARGTETTRLTWTVDAEGFGTAVLGRLFAWVYSRSLNKAIPALVAAMNETGAGPKA